MSCHDLGLLAPKKYELEFLNGIINIHFCLEAEVKIGGRKNLLTLPDSTPAGPRPSVYFHFQL